MTQRWTHITVSRLNAERLEEIAKANDLCIDDVIDMMFEFIDEVKEVYELK